MLEEVMRRNPKYHRKCAEENLVHRKKQKPVPFKNKRKFTQNQKYLEVFYFETSKTG